MWFSSLQENTGVAPRFGHCPFIRNPIRFVQKMRTFLELFTVKIPRCVQLHFSYVALSRDCMSLCFLAFVNRCHLLLLSVSPTALCVSCFEIVSRSCHRVQITRRQGNNISRGLALFLKRDTLLHSKQGRERWEI